VDDERRSDPTSRLLEDFVREVSEQVVVPELPGRHRGPPRRAPGVPRGVRVLAAVVTVAAVVAAVVLVVVYGPRSARISPGRTPATQPSPGPTQPTPGTTSTVPSVTATEQITYQPFTATGIDPSLHVTSQVTGTCIRYGGGAAGRFSYRCFSTPGGVYDPCFAGPTSTAAPLVCPTSPTSDDVVELAVTSITSNEPPSAAKIPWAMQLSGGQVCLLVSAAWGGLGPYACQASGNQESVADCHTPVAAQPLWTAACQAQETDASPFAASSVTKVWY